MQRLLQIFTSKSTKEIFYLVLEPLYITIALFLTLNKN